MTQGSAPDSATPSSLSEDCRQWPSVDHFGGDPAGGEGLTQEALRVAVQAHDAVMVLGKELRHEPNRARRELRARSAAAAVALAVEGGPRCVLTLEAPLRGQAEAGSTIVCRYLRELGVLDNQMVVERRTRSTREEALGARRVLRGRGLQRVLVLTTSYHVPRAQQIFEDVLGPGATVWAAADLGPLAAGRAAAWIDGGRPDAPTLVAEGRVERRFHRLARWLTPLPRAVRWQLEVQAGALLRGMTGLGK